MSIHSIMTTDESGKELVDYAQQVATTLVRNDLKRAQIRTIFSEVRQIEAMWGSGNRPQAMRRLNMLKPKLSYQAARNHSVEPLKLVLSEAIDEVEKAPAEKKDAAFQRFVNFFEAVLAYHRAQGGRD